jgi:hypothetical protein
LESFSTSAFAWEIPGAASIAATEVAISQLFTGFFIMFLLVFRGNGARLVKCQIELKNEGRIFVVVRNFS